MLHPHTTLAWINDTVGVGVIATRPIPAGTITWVRDALDLVFTPAQISALGQGYAAMLDRYAYGEADGVVLCWDHGRFVNHHCEASCLGLDGPFEIAVRDIAEGEELTDDYGSLRLDEAMRCACGSPTCRGEIRPDDPVAHLAHWRARYDAATLQAPWVEQPLLGAARLVLGPDTRALLDGVIRPTVGQRDGRLRA